LERRSIFWNIGALLVVKTFDKMDFLSPSPMSLISILTLTYFHLEGRKLENPSRYLQLYTLFIDGL